MKTLNERAREYISEHHNVIATSKNSNEDPIYAEVVTKTMQHILAGIYIAGAKAVIAEIRDKAAEKRVSTFQKFNGDWVGGTIDWDDLDKILREVENG